MNFHRPLSFAVLTLCGACATNTTLPAIPEYHPASPSATEAPRIESFDVLAVAPAPAPSLPVPVGEQLPPGDPKMQGSMGNKKDMPAPVTPAPENRMEPASGEEIHGEVHRQGMREPATTEGHNAPFPEDHPPASSMAHGDIDDKVQRGEASMNPIEIPSEQRGMHADSTLYHEHKHHDSTHITHPNRAAEGDSIAGRQTWKCPMHPDVAATTPGGRCPRCETILVPVKASDE